VVHNNKAMKEKDCKKIISDLINFGSTTFDFTGGGEPFVVPYLSDVFHLIAEKDCNYGIITNGTLLIDSLCYQIVKQATYIKISLEASNPKDYCKYKRIFERHWHQVLDNIESLVFYKKQTKSNCEIRIKFAVSKSLRGEKHYKDAFYLKEELGVDSIQFKAMRHQPEELSLKEKRVEEKILKSLKHPSNCYYWIVPEKPTKCWLSPVQTSIDYAGNVYLCCYFYYRGKEHWLGNMLEKPIKSIWYSPQHQQKIQNIDIKQCSKVDCKFFKHHNIINEATKANAWNFI
jgi:pyruvate-formate lyase-activating enzyme